MTEAYELGEEEPTYVEVWRPTGLTGQGQWVRIEGLHARSVQLALQPSAGISSATLEYHYGEIDRGDSAGWKLYKPLGDGSSALSEAFGTINPVDLKHRAFRVNMLNGETGIVESQFVGFVTAVAYEQHKPATLETFNDVAEEYGNQIIELAGPE